MAGETVITVVGNLTADPELRYTQNGLAVANFTIASTPREFDKASGEWTDGEALFLRASVWREFAEHVAGSLTKGARVIAQGRLKQRSYETKEGEKRTSMELEIDEIGPSLKYATAQVIRTQSSGTQRDNRQAQQRQQPQGGGQQRQAGPPQGGGGYAGPPQGGGYGGPPQQGQGWAPSQGDEPWAAGPQQQTTQPPATGDGWNTPGSYSDDTPF